jgi:hypothetical protein
MAFTLAEFSNQGWKRGQLGPRLDSISHYEAMVFVSQFFEFYDKLPGNEGKALLGRVRGCFSNPDDLRGLQFEWLIATHLSRRGFEIDFPRLTGVSSSDLFATKNGVLTEVECKSISNNKGRQIHRREALDIHNIIYKDCKKLLLHLATGLCVRVVVPKRLPNRYDDHKALSKAVRNVILSAESDRTPAAEITIKQFDIASSPFVIDAPDRQEVMDFLEERLAIHNKEVFIDYTPGKRAFILSLESATPDDPIGSALDVASDAHARQLSGKSPGVICIKFEDLSASQLTELGAEQGEPSALRRRVSAFLDKRQKSHLVCLAFFADGLLVKNTDGGISQEGVSYFFDNSASHLYNEVSVNAFRTLSSE